MAALERYVFIVEWFDTRASLIRTYQLSYFPNDNTLEMVHPIDLTPSLI